MGYDRGDSFPFDFEPNTIPFGFKSKVKLSPRSYPIQCERKWKYSFLSVLCSDIPHDIILEKLTGHTREMSGTFGVFFSSFYNSLFFEIYGA